MISRSFSPIMLFRSVLKLILGAVAVFERSEKKNFDISLKRNSIHSKAKVRIILNDPTEEWIIIRVKGEWMTVLIVVVVLDCCPCAALGAELRLERCCAWSGVAEARRRWKIFAIFRFQQLKMNKTWRKLTQKNKKEGKGRKRKKKEGKGKKKEGMKEIQRKRQKAGVATCYSFRAFFSLCLFPSLPSLAFLSFHFFSSLFFYHFQTLVFSFNMSRFQSVVHFDHSPISISYQQSLCYYLTAARSNKRFISTCFDKGEEWDLYT